MSSARHLAAPEATIAATRTNEIARRVTVMCSSSGRAAIRGATLGRYASSGLEGPTGGQLTRRALPKTLDPRLHPLDAYANSVEGSSSTAARTNPFRDGFAVRALSARMGLLARPACAQPHRPVPAGALLRLELGLLFRVCQVGDILGKPPVHTDGYVFQSGSACIQGRWPVS
jgi:hypothetical protein